ncbi:hypothetical protein IKS57_05920 [bacterium]|nr:hypothetical protein [bacterium]
MQSRYKEYEQKSSISILYNLVSKSLTDSFNERAVLLETTLEPYKK